MKIHFPWEKLQPQESFFVPTLDVHGVRERGLKAALPFRIHTRATIGVKDGLIGVLFERRGRKPDSTSEPS
jgi:hypothetical protein